MGMTKRELRCFCRGYPTRAVSNVIIETGRPRGRGTEKEDNNNKAVGQV